VCVCRDVHDVYMCQDILIYLYINVCILIYAFSVHMVIGV
jgi:hypothetical protein